MSEATKSSARAFFEWIRDSADRVAAIESLANKDNPTFEEEWLEFKQATLEDKDNAKKWSEVATAFANTAGGVLVWGIKSDKQKRDGHEKRIDYASELKPIAKTLDLQESLKSRILHIADPYISGVEYLPVEDQANNGRGYLVCYVPESRNRPHRAQLVEFQPYLIRVGDNSVSPHPSLLRLMFFPQLRANLVLKVHGIHAAADPSIRYINRSRDYDTYVWFDLTNSGPATYSGGVVLLTLNYPLSGIGHTWGNVRNGASSFEASFTEPVHPYTTRRVVRLNVRGQEMVDVSLTFFGQDFDPVVFRWRGTDFWFANTYALDHPFGHAELFPKSLSDYETEMEGQ